MSDQWTILSLKEHMDRVIAENDRRYTERFESAEQAVAKAEKAQEAYNIRSNEFRQALDDQNKHMLPRAEADIRFAQMRAQSNWVIGLVVVIVLAMIGWVISLTR